jgi:hypothetical protein
MNCRNCGGETFGKYYCSVSCWKEHKGKMSKEGENNE